LDTILCNHFGPRLVPESPLQHLPSQELRVIQDCTKSNKVERSAGKLDSCGDILAITKFRSKESLISLSSLLDFLTDFAAVELFEISSSCSLYSLLTSDPIASCSNPQTSLYPTRKFSLLRSGHAVGSGRQCANLHTSTHRPGPGTPRPSLVTTHPCYSSIARYQASMSRL
jgi:hypothetical protein